jgi:Fic family protein
MKNLIKTKEKYLKLSKGVYEFDKHNQYAIIHHSDSIEGSTLTEDETVLLLEDGLTPKGKPATDTLMALDHFVAVKYVYKLAKSKTPLSCQVVQYLSSLILRKTGHPISSMGGEFDSSKGDFRTLSVRATNHTYESHLKVKAMTETLCNKINSNITKTDFESVNNLAFDSHFELITIHPFADGNGRLSRLIMNYIQLYHEQPLSIVFKEDKSDYISALKESRASKDDNDKYDFKPFRNFMYAQLNKHLKQEVKTLSPKKSKGIGM